MMTPLKGDVPTLARKAFITVLMNIIRVCNLNQSGQTIFVVTDAVQEFVYHTVKQGLATKKTDSDYITTIVLLALLGIDVQEFTIVQTILNNSYVIFPKLRNAARRIWITGDYTKSTTRATLTAVLSGAGVLMNDVTQLASGIDFRLDTHSADLKQCFVEFSRIILASLDGVRIFPSNETELTTHLAIRSMFIQTSFGRSKKFILDALNAFLEHIPHYTRMREPPVSFASFAMWLVQFVIILLVCYGTSLVETPEPFLLRFVRRVMEWV